MKYFLGLTLCVLFMSAPHSYADVLQVKGRFLTTPCGDTIVLRGVNKLSIFDADNFGIGIFKEVRKTGANVLRIVWNMSDKASTIANLDMVIQACIDNQMIPMVEMHDATGDWSKLPAVTAYWLRPEMVSLIQKHEKYIIVNIANEAGDFDVKDKMFSETYSSIVAQFRLKGVNVPLVIDASGYGQNVDIIINNADDIIKADTKKNLIFSLHAYWAPKYFANPPQLLTSKVKEIVAKDIPFIIGEFAGCYTDDPNSTDDLWKTILPLCEENRIGWIAWEWGPGNADYSVDPPIPYPKMDLTADGRFETIKDGWSKEILLVDANSIAKTSITPEYIKRKGNCINADVANNENAEVLVHMQPQPVHRTLHLELSEPTSVRIMNLMGCEMASAVPSLHHSIDCASFANGSYVVLLENTHGTWARSFLVMH